MTQMGGLTTGRVFTAPNSKAYDQLKWRERNSIIVDRTTPERLTIRQDTEFPEGWSLDAINAVSQQYFTGGYGTADGEKSLRQPIDRVVDTVTRQGLQEAYFETDEEAEDFREELKYALATQRVTFNSVVWRNIGVSGRVQKVSDCFIVGAEDALEPIFNWHTDEGMVVGGVGINITTNPVSAEPLNRGGDSIYPLTKRVVLAVNHPDIEQFIAHRAAEGRDPQTLGNVDTRSYMAENEQYWGVSSSIRLTDDFMHAVQGGSEWDLIAPGATNVVKTVKSRDLLQDMARAAWNHANVTMQFDATINRWHTAPRAGRINTSSPNGGYLHLDSSACNSATINLLAYLRNDNTFDVEAFRHTIELMLMAQEILVGYGAYPSQTITKNAKTYRQLSMGYTNLAALLMAMGLSYDSDEGRAIAAAITALMTGHAYTVSAKVARRIGPFAGYRKDREVMQNVLQMHRAEVPRINPSLVPEELLSAAATAWDEAVELTELYGVRNSQATAIGSTGVISRALGCESTGARPVSSLLGRDYMSDGSSVTVVKETAIRALKSLGYTREQTDAIVAHILKAGSVTGAPHLKDSHLDVFACATGDRVVHYLAHIKMMSAIQPFLSGAVDEALRLPAEATADSIEQIYVSAWQAGLKTVTVHRDSYDLIRPIPSESEDETGLVGSEESKTQDLVDAEFEEKEEDEAIVVNIASVKRRNLPRRHRGMMYKFSIDGLEGSATVGEYDDGTPGQLEINIAAHDSDSSRLAEALITSINHGLQYGVPLRAFIEAMMNTKYAPSGATDDPEIQTTSSATDYIARRLALDYLSSDDCIELGITTAGDTHDDQAKLPTGDRPIEEPTSVRKHLTATEDVLADAHEAPSAVIAVPPTETMNAEEHHSAPLCYNCGNQTRHEGSYYVCGSCGSTTSFS